KRFWDVYLKEHVVSRLPGYDGEAGMPGYYREVVQIEPAIRQRLYRLSNTLEVPVRTALLCAHMRITSMLTGTDDAISGLVCNVRPEEKDGDKVLGLFLNTLPIRQKFKSACWNDRIRETLSSELAVMQHRRYPY